MDIVKSIIIAGLKSEEIKINDLQVDFDKLINNVCFGLICEIKALLEEENSDFDCIDKIITLLSGYEIDISVRHDFG